MREEKEQKNDLPAKQRAGNIVWGRLPDRWRGAGSRYISSDLLSEHRRKERFRKRVKVGYLILGSMFLFVNLWVLLSGELFRAIGPILASDLGAAGTLFAQLSFQTCGALIGVYGISKYIGRWLQSSQFFLTSMLVP